MLLRAEFSESCSTVLLLLRLLCERRVLVWAPGISLAATPSSTEIQQFFPHLEALSRLIATLARGLQDLSSPSPPPVEALNTMALSS